MLRLTRASALEPTALFSRGSTALSGPEHLETPSEQQTHHVTDSGARWEAPRQSPMAAGSHRGRRYREEELRGPRRSACGLVDEGRILIDVDLFTTHRIADPLGALDRFLADDHLLGNSRLLLDIDGLAAQRHVDDRLLEGASIRRRGSPIDDPSLHPDALLGDRHLQRLLLGDDVFLDAHRPGFLLADRRGELLLHDRDAHLVRGGYLVGADFCASPATVSRADIAVGEDRPAIRHARWHDLRHRIPAAVERRILGDIQRDLAIGGAGDRTHRDVIVGGKKEALLDDDVARLDLGHCTDFVAVGTVDIIANSDLIGIARTAHCAVSSFMKTPALTASCGVLDLGAGKALAGHVPPWTDPEVTCPLSGAVNEVRPFVATDPAPERTRQQRQQQPKEGAEGAVADRLERLWIVGCRDRFLRLLGRSEEHT